MSSQLKIKLGVDANKYGISTIQLREVVLKKVLQGTNPNMKLQKSLELGRSTIGEWLREYKQNGSINLNPKEKRPKDWTAEERLSALIETGLMSVEDRTGTQKKLHRC